MENYLSGLGNYCVVINHSDDRGCSYKLHLRSSMEILWSERAYFGLLGNTHIFLIIVLYHI